MQVCSEKVVLLAGSSKQAETTVQDLVSPPEAPTGVQSERAAAAALPGNLAGVEILAASAADPYVLLHLSNGSAALLKGSLDTGQSSLVTSSCVRLLITSSAIVMKTLTTRQSGS